MTISLYDVIRSTIALAVLLSVALYLASLIEARIRTSQTLSPTVQVLFTKSLKMVLISLAVLVAINSVGIDLTALAVLGGLLGVGIGFGLQKIVSNLISGVILLIDKSIKPGDIISVAGTYGWVTALGGRYVSVVTRDGVEHLIPNETLISEPVENWTHTQRRTRLKLDLGRASRVRLEAGHRALRGRGARDRARAAGAGAEVPVHRVRRELAEAAAALLDRRRAERRAERQERRAASRSGSGSRQHGVRVPYPQRDLHIRSSAERAPLQALA